ncbi:MAG: tRNA (N(6)-L-threonylcarbamoyladenosine(37)-C(2))-methylthiotransferase MtaB [bacterium]|nr:tRNA (N(6)-L-threonylcarbamoyladenosine(37)-C(2))-methylthiotransferase MtaB [bacterium]
MTLPKVAISTLGCKVNQFESAALESAFTASGCEPAPSGAQADIHVINTCAVTARAGQQSRQLIRRILQENPTAKVVVTGCYAQVEAETVRTLDTRILVVGNSHKEGLVRAALVEKEPGHAQALHGPMEEKRDIFNLQVRAFSGRTRAFLRIQDGCNNFCSYCIVPHTRGRSRSLPKAQVLCQAAIFAEAGYRELVITGINTGKYGLDLAEGMDINRLLAELCTQFPQMRFRLSSIEPTEIDEAFLALAAQHSNLMPHFHIPLQSGHNRILAAMRRRYTAEDFAAVVERLHAALPQAAIGCDVLTAFPGETDQEAAHTRTLLADLPISYLHVFPYSKRPGTPAAAMPNQVAAADKKERVGRLHELDHKLRRQFYQAHLGRGFQVLVERRLRKQPGMLQGFSENYIPITFAGPGSLVRNLATVRLDRLTAEGPLGVRLNT